MAFDAGALARRGGTGLSVIQREIDRARDDLEAALGDLQLAAKELTTVRHWRLVAQRAFRKRPGLVLLAAGFVGYRLGRRRGRV